MILVMAGTRDGREIAAALSNAGLEVVTSVTSGYGKELAEASGVRALSEAMTAEELERFIRQQNISLVIDATHPYAVNVSKNSAMAATRAGVHCVRYERPVSFVPAYEKLTVAADMSEAARVCVTLGKTVFLTVGSHQLGVFRAAAALTGCRLVARVLPQPDVIAACLGAGFTPRDIVALQGPFSKQLNMALFREFAADVVVTKNSGSIGGTDEKIEAAMELKLALVIVGRPPLGQQPVFDSIPALLEFVQGRGGKL